MLMTILGGFISKTVWTRVYFCRSWSWDALLCMFSLHCSNTFDSNEWRVIRLGHLFEMRCVEVGTNLKHASPRTQNLTHLTEVTISLSYLQSEGPAGFTLSHNQQGCMSRLIFKQNRLQYCLQSYVWMHFGLNFDTLLAYKSREHTVMKLDMYIFFFYSKWLL